MAIYNVSVKVSRGEYQYYLRRACNCREVLVRYFQGFSYLGVTPRAVSGYRISIYGNDQEKLLTVYTNRKKEMENFLQQAFLPLEELKFSKRLFRIVLSGNAAQLLANTGQFMWRMSGLLLFVGNVETLLIPALDKVKAGEKPIDAAIKALILFSRVPGSSQNRYLTGGVTPTALCRSALALLAQKQEEPGDFGTNILWNGIASYGQALVSQDPTIIKLVDDFPE